jgi:hypothetical protein
MCLESTYSVQTVKGVKRYSSGRLQKAKNKKARCDTAGHLKDWKPRFLLFGYSTAFPSRSWRAMANFSISS